MEDYDVPGLFALEPSAAVARPGTRGSAENACNDAPPGQKARLGTGSAALSWVPGGLALPSIRVGKPEVPIPAIVSRSLLDVAEARLGDTLIIGTIDATVPIQVVAIADYFPTLNPREEPFIVMDLRKKDRFFPLHTDLAEMMQQLGFIYDDLIVWDRRHEYNNMRPLGYPYKFRINKAHEFILIFQKPGGT